MKTLKGLLPLIILLLAGQLSFGTGNDTCCPDSPRTEISADTQVQLDHLQADTHLATATVPSLQGVVSKKLQARDVMMKQVQVESEMLDITLYHSFSEQLASRLNSQVPERKVENSRAAKF